MKFFTPVIHVKDLDQTIKNVEMCLESNTDGFFLISHILNFKKFLPIVEYIRYKYPTFWIGVNILDKHPLDIIPELPPIEALWTDDSYLDEIHLKQHIPGQIVTCLKNRCNSKALWFGGVAFKYQTQPQNLIETTKLSSTFLDVITTSGNETGSPADIQKIRQMKDLIENKSLGIASGISVNNVNDYLPYVDYFLVATHISTDFHNLNPVLVKKMMETIDSFRKSR